MGGEHIKSDDGVGRVLRSRVGSAANRVPPHPILQLLHHRGREKDF